MHWTNPFVSPCMQDWAHNKDKPVSCLKLRSQLVGSQINTDNRGYHKNRSNVCPRLHLPAGDPRCLVLHFRSSILHLRSSIFFFTEYAPYPRSPRPLGWREVRPWAEFG